MRKTEGGRVPLRPHLIQRNIVILHSENRRRAPLFKRQALFSEREVQKHVVTRKSETVFECFSFMGPDEARFKLISTIKMTY